MDDNLRASDVVRDHVIKSEPDMNPPCQDVTMLNLAGHPELDAKLIVNALEGTERKKGKKRKRKANKVNESEVQVMDKMLLNSGTTVKTEIKEEEAVLPLSHQQSYAGSTQSALTMVLNEAESMNHKEIHMGTAENLSEAMDQIDHHAEPADKIQDCGVVSSLSENKFLDTVATLPIVPEQPGSVCVAENNGDGKRKRRSRYKRSRKKRMKEREKTRWEIESMNNADAMYKILLPDDHFVARTDELPNINSNDCKSVLLADVLGISSKDTPGSVSECPLPLPITMDLDRNSRIALTTPIRRKLLVLDVNGLLANIIMPAPKDRRGDTNILRRAIFKRPYCDDFLNFCFQNFDVGLWSSRAKVLIERVVDYLLGDLRGKLKFCWNMWHATQTGYKTLENNHKPLVCKELRKIWEVTYPDSRWKKGDYDESNTLLLDDSPYKALLNPLHTAIFPRTFNYEDDNDNSLGPGGDLRVYLEGLLACDNVQKYVEQNPFGQGAINETNSSWEFYSGVLQTLTNQLEGNCQELPPVLVQELPPVLCQELPPVIGQELPPMLPTQNQELPPVLGQELELPPPMPSQELPAPLTN